MHTLRKKAVQDILTRRPLENTLNEHKVTLHFADDVLSAQALRKLLPESSYRRFIEEMDSELDPSLADQVANAMKEWALSKGATHYTHWFQPMTGATAEKHDSFIKFGDDGKIIQELSGKELIKGETDGSSFPSGGIRSTFEARGYTCWDMTSPAFVRRGPNGATLCVPTAFLSWTGEALDTKAPLLRSEERICKEATKLLNVLGFTNVTSVYSTLGAEQEFFLIDKAFFAARPDLRACGRSLLGTRPPKGQQLEDHYFAKMPHRVLSCIREAEAILERLGVPLKTRHNEVSPSQYEVAPIFERSTIASDHNMLTMEVIQEVADRHDLAMLVHEKPFANVNGSGKHNNWSLCSNTGINLLEPGVDPKSNVRFMVVLAAIIRGLHLHGDLLRASVTVPGNDHRLGANEAPPAIISIYLGAELDRICQELLNEVKGGRKSPEHANAPPAKDAKVLERRQSAIRLGVDALPKIPKDTTDRNRTSPFAFTGNKFEFRAVGSSQSCAVPVYHVNTIVADSLNFVTSEIQTRVAKGAAVEDAANEVVHEILVKHYAVVFNGNNYSEEWVQEATRRGLPILKTAPDALAVYNAKKNLDLFSRMGVLSSVELQARTHIMYETFLKRLHIEGTCLLSMLNTMVLPASIHFQERVATSYNATRAALGSDASLASQKALLERVVGLVAQLQAEIASLATLLKEETSSHAEESKKLAEFHPRITVALRSARTVADELETIVDDDLWPLPKYSEILFMK